jgi:hypothetical protein
MKSLGEQFPGVVAAFSTLDVAVALFLLDKERTRENPLTAPKVKPVWAHSNMARLNSLLGMIYYVVN